MCSVHCVPQLSYCCCGTPQSPSPNSGYYKGEDKSLARPGRKQANVSVRMAWISFGALLCGGWTWWQLASRCCWNRARPWHASELVSFLVGLRTYQHPGKCCNTRHYIFLPHSSQLFSQSILFHAPEQKQTNELTNQLIARNGVFLKKRTVF